MTIVIAFALAGALVVAGLGYPAFLRAMGTAMGTAPSGAINATP